MSIGVERMRALVARLNAQKQVLVLITDRTEWERPELKIKPPLPEVGYALASRSTHNAKRYDKRAYVTDVNDDDAWRELFDVVPTLSAAADLLQV